MNDLFVTAAARHLIFGQTLVKIKESQARNFWLVLFHGHRAASLQALTLAVPLSKQCLQSWKMETLSIQVQDRRDQGHRVDLSSRQGLAKQKVQQRGGQIWR